MTDEHRKMANGRTAQFPPATEEWFQTLQPVRAQEMIGLWQGAGIPAGHPLDGVLENLGWFGKRFHADMQADALLFQSTPGRLVAIDPAFIPLRLALRFSAFGRTCKELVLISSKSAACTRHHRIATSRRLQ